VVQEAMWAWVVATRRSTIVLASSTPITNKTRRGRAAARRSVGCVSPRIRAAAACFPYG
jgi:hypothetical protein